MFQPWSKREAALGRIEFIIFYCDLQCPPPLFAGEVMETEINCNAKLYVNCRAARQ